MNVRVLQGLKSWKFIWIGLILAVLDSCTGLHAQEIGYYKMNYLKSDIAVSYSKNSGKVVTSNEIYLTALQPNAGVNIYFNRLQTFQEFEVYQKKENSPKYTMINPVAEVTGAETGVTYSGLNRVILYLPDTGKFKVIYKLEAADLLLAGALNLADESFDSVKYSYKLSPKLRLLFKIDGDSSCIVHYKGKSTEDFKIYPKQSLNDYILIQQQQNLQMPLASNLRVLIVPDEYSGNPEVYFSGWYFRQLGENRKLNEVSRQIADSICGDLSDTLSIINALFRYVNQKINYVGLFDSWNAFIPIPVDDVLQKRFGDCKNMANLLTSLLDYKGIEAYYGITASIYHPVDMDFPSLASGDHAICVVRVKSEWLFLDPTNKLSMELIPPGYIQGRHVLVLDQEHPFFLKIPSRSADKNLKQVNLELNYNDNNLDGTFDAKMTGYCRQEIVGNYFALGRQLFPKLLSPAVLGSFFEFSVESIDYSFDDTIFNVAGKINSRNFTVEKLKNGNSALFPDFVQIPDVFTGSNQKFEVIVGEAQRYELKYNLQFEHPVRLCPYSPVLFDEDGLVYKMAVTQSGAQSFQISVVYEIPYSIIRVDDLDKVKTCSQLIYRTMRHAIEIQ
jgi:hypothetical protein